MCTAISWQANSHFFGRNLDLDYHYAEQISIVPRYYKLSFRHGYQIDEHYAWIGMSTVVGGYPLFYDATNEMGLSIAGLNFPNNAVYQSPDPQKFNLASFELIPWIMATYQTVAEVKEQIVNWNITNEAFSSEFPPSPLHWLISDAKESIVVEVEKDGLFVYDNPVHVLTNNPPFPYQLFSLNNYRYLNTQEHVNTALPNQELEVYSLGLGGLGLPGDLSSNSRFVRAVFTREKASFSTVKTEEIHQFFHILESVKQVNGLCFVPHSQKYEYTLYTSCVDTKEGIYYYKTYYNSKIHGINMHNVNLDTDKLCSFDLCYIEDIQVDN